VERPGAEGVQGVVAEYDQKHPEVQVEGGRLDRRHEDHERDPLRERARRRQLVHRPRTSASTAERAPGSTRPVPEEDKIDLSQFPKTSLYYTQYKGKRCALPLLADSYGLYYNKAMFAKAGIKRPPRTMTELTADAKKLTQRSGAKIKVAATTRSGASTRATSPT